MDGRNALAAAALEEGELVAGVDPNRPPRRDTKPLPEEIDPGETFVATTSATPLVGVGVSLITVKFSSLEVNNLSERSAVFSLVGVGMSFTSDGLSVCEDMSLALSFWLKIGGKVVVVVVVVVEAAGGESSILLNDAEDSWKLNTLQEEQKGERMTRCEHMI